MGFPSIGTGMADRASPVSEKPRLLGKWLLAGWYRFLTVDARAFHNFRLWEWHHPHWLADANDF
jgi:hypothetical protein